MGKLIDLKDKEFNGIKILEPLKRRSSGGCVYWKCICLNCSSILELKGLNVMKGWYSCSCGKIVHIKKEKGLRRAINFIDLKDKVFGSLTVKELVSKRDRRGGCYWKCICSCGNIIDVSSVYLRRGSVNSCGCKHYLTGNESNVWTGYEGLPGRKWTLVLRGAKLRNIKVEIDIKYAWELYLKQNRKCALSGLDINFKDTSASLDRIDSKKGYIEGNVQWVHKDVNFMKQSYSQEYYINICNKVQGYQQETSCAGGKCLT